MLTQIRSWDDATETVRDIWGANSLRGRFVRGAVWSLIGAVMSQGSTLAAYVITARFLGREQFGEYGMLQSTVGMFGVFAGMGLGLTATKHVAELRATNPDRAARIIALCTSVALGTGIIALMGLLILAPWLAASILNAPYLSSELRIASGALFLNALNGTQTGVLAGFEAFRTIARVNLVRGMLTFPMVVACVRVWRLPGAATALVGAAAIGWVLNYVAIRAECKRNKIFVRWKRFWSERAILWKFSVPAFLCSIMVGPAMWAASSMLVNQPHGYAEMGVFTAANQWRTAVVFLPSLLSQPLLSMLSNVGAGDFGSFWKLVRGNLLLNFAISALIAAPIVLCSPWIMKAYGRDFLAGAPVLILLVLATLIDSTASVVGQAIASLDRMWWGFTLNFVWGLVLLASAALLVPRYGALGLAEAFLVSYSVHALSVGTYAHVYLTNRSIGSLRAVRGPCDAP